MTWLAGWTCSDLLNYRGSRSIVRMSEKLKELRAKFEKSKTDSTARNKGGTPIVAPGEVLIGKNLFGDLLDIIEEQAKEIAELRGRPHS